MSQSKRSRKQRYEALDLAGRRLPVWVESRSRRLFLGGLSGAFLALPWLESLSPRSAGAQAETPPRRFICMKSFSTQLVKAWYPKFRGNGYQLHDDVYSGSKADGTTLLHTPLAGGPWTSAALGDLVGDAGISDILGDFLNPYLDKLTLIRGLDFLPSVNHNFGGLLGNFASCTTATPCDADTLEAVPTIDQVLAYSPKFYGTAPPLRALHVSQGVEDAMSYTDLGQVGGPVEQMKARTNPRDVWSDLFGSLMDPGQGPSPNLLLVDHVMTEYRELQKSSRLSLADKQRLDRHLTHLTELEARLGGGGGLSCTRPLEPQSLPNNSGTDPSEIAAKWDVLLELVALGLSCDRTRIVTLGVHKALGPGPDPDEAELSGHYHSEDASGGTWHGLAHDFSNENSRRMLQGINTWIAEHVFLKLIAKLDAIEEEGGSSLLDNSLVYWGNELGFNHIAHSVPCLLAGSAGGFLKTGRYLDYIDWENHSYFSQEDGNVIEGIPHNRFLVTALQAMGLEPADYERNGAPGYGSTSTSGRDPNLWPVDYDLTAIGQMLPGIRG